VEVEARKENNKEKIKKRSKEYYCKNRSKIIAAREEYRKNNKEKIKQRDKEYYYKNHSKIIVASKEYRKNNKEKIKNKCREHYYKNHSAKLTKSREYSNSHKEECRERHRRRYRNRAKTDPIFKLKICLRSRVCAALKGNFKKAAKTMDLIGCSIEFLWAHLEAQFQPGMTRENHGEWHIDHKRPIDSFDMADPAQQRECFHWKNLQPLWKLDNILKGAKYNPSISEVI
jgi:hypothetical protein